MLKKETHARLRWHAGMEDLEVGGLSSISTCTSPAESMPLSALEDAVADFLATLFSLNHELNGEVPSRNSGSDESIPLSLVYAVTEAIRLLREYEDRVIHTETSEILSRLVWRVQTAWSKVLAGDIDDIERDLGSEEAARFG